VRIITNTQERLVLYVRHTVMAGICWGCAVILMYGIANKWAELDLPAAWAMSLTALGFASIAIYFLRPSVFDFDRTSNRFRWTRPGLFRSRHDEVRLDSIKRVRVDTIDSDGHDAHRVVVETGGRTVPLQHMYWTGNSGEYQHIVGLIRTWLAR
jgi:hypothetical protein